MTIKRAVLKKSDGLQPLLRSNAAYCAVRTACRSRTETLVAAWGRKLRATKPALRPRCHAGIDSGADFTQDERRALMDMAIVRTHSRLIESGKVRLCK